jgi:alpha-amylase
VNRLSFFILFIVFSSHAVWAQPAERVKKVLVQAFWWDYKNNNYPNGWANYLTDLAPRLKGMGVDAVWIPPSVKNQDYGEKGVGYAPYDHYDLGDKYQKNDAATRLGTKDELLRLIAVLHANGIEVVQDIVPNHLIGAGSDNGSGGQDPAAPSAGCTDTWKNFRYTCYETPATDQSTTDYFGRKGRFPKNYHNFHPNAGHGCNNSLCSTGTAEEAVCWQGFGPDICYYDGAQGLSSNALTFNPDQSTYSPYNNMGTGTNNGYMRKHTREWLIWYKRQTGFDGVRIDAVKHFPNFASEDFLWNLQNNATWANGTDKMFAVGEWVGDDAALNAWTTAVQNRAGTFDFNLRAFHSSGGLRSMIYSNGGFDMGNLPGAQQGTDVSGGGRYIDIAGVRIHRTVPFINNHDTYRPCLMSNGKIIGWKDGSSCHPLCKNGDGSCSNDELSQHVDIREPRLAAAYAAMFAMDGNPQVFFEDLFNIANTGKRWTHLPTNTTDLPENQDIANIIKLHGALDFKGGDYKVPSNIASFWNNVTNSNNNDDHLVIERSGKAIVGVTDSWATDQDAWIDTNFPVGTVLQDYSGGIATTTVVQTPAVSGGPNRVNIKTRAVGWPSFVYDSLYADHGAHYHGYSVWAPQGIDLNAYSNAAIPTTQEWEMENDLGDSHCSSLGQGGRTPDNSPNARVVGKIFAAANSTVTFSDSLGNVAIGQIIEFYDLQGNLLHAANGTGVKIAGSFVNTATRWIAVKIRNAAANTVGQKSWVRLTYQAPAVANTLAFPAANQVSVWTSNGGSSNWNDCKNWEEGKIPVCTGTVVIPHAVKFMPTFDACFTGTFINRATLSVSPKVFLQGCYNGTDMNDALRAAGLVPTVSPYNGGTETTTAAVLAVTGTNAIVDWVKIELRSNTNPAVIVQTRSALLQRDGDIVGTDGVSPVFFDRMQPNDSFYVAVRHRNHLGFRTNQKVALTEFIYAPDHRNSITGVYGTNPLRNVGSLQPVYVMYSGDANSDGTVNAVDRNAHWRVQNGQTYFYLTSKADFNLDGAVNAVDRNAHWRVNNSLIEQM